MVNTLLALALLSAPLKPGMPAVQPLSVPALWADVPDADLLPQPPRIEPEKAFRWVLAPGETFRATARVESATGADRATLTVWDWNNTPVLQQAVTAPGETSLVLPVEGRGTWLLTLDLFAGQKCLGRLARSFSICPPNLERRKGWRAEEFFVGTCAFPGRQHWTNAYGPARPKGLTDEEALNLDAELSARLGLQVVRPDVPVRWPGEDAPIDFSPVDRSFAAWTSRGFKLALQLPKPGDWAILPKYDGVADPRWRYPKREAPSRKLVSELARRYAKDTLFFELYNEPDNKDFWRGTPEEFLDLMGWMHEETRRSAPASTIGGCALCLIEPEWTGQIARAARGRLDWVSYHSHGDVRALADILKAMRAVHAAAGYEKPLFVNTEMGHAAWRLDQERSMATTSVQKLLYCWAHGHRGALLYCSRDIGGPRISAGDWGAIDHFMCPRFVYGAVAAFIDTLAGFRFEGVLEESRLRHVFLFRDGDRRIVAAYAPDQQSRRLVLDAGTARAEIADAMGNRHPADKTPIDLTLSGYPTFVLLEGASQVRVVE